MDTKDWIVVFATLAGPILAVQTQKAIERLRERRNQKEWIFARLMATRASRVSPEHVQALNMIDVVFYGRHIFAFKWTTKGEQKVLDAWKEYLDHLTPNRYNKSPASPEWHTRGEDLFIKLLSEIAADLGFHFDSVQLKKGVYSPAAHGDFENEQKNLRHAALQALTGKTSLKMDVVGFTVNPVSIQSQTETLRTSNDES